MWTCSPRCVRKLPSMRLGNSLTESRRDFSRIAQRFNAGPEPSEPHKSRRDERSAGQAGISVVPAGLVAPFLADPSVETLGYSQSSLRDAACETAGAIFRKALSLACIFPGGGEADRPKGSSADFRVCGIADFQIGKGSESSPRSQVRKPAIRQARRPALLPRGANFQSSRSRLNCALAAR